VASLNDFRPTDQEIEVLGILTKQLAAYQEQWRQIVAADVQTFNSAVREKGMTGGVVVGRQ